MHLYARYRKDPQSVPSDWMVHFETLDGGPERGESDPSLLGQALVDAYRTHGHKEARLDPLGMTSPKRAQELVAAKARATAGRCELTIAGKPIEMTGKRADEILRDIYCGYAAIEAAHIEDPGDRAWIYEAFEKEVLADADEGVLSLALEAVLLADEFERFIKTKWPTKKRFGIEGSESSTVILREIFRQAARAGQAEVVIGGMHRGRLATLATVLGKSLPILIAEIKGRDITDGDAVFTGDVPYHNGLATNVETDSGALEVRLLPHPSHLTVVAAVAAGAARARQELRAREGAPGEVLPVLMHTDAAFAGQGLVSELLQLGGLDGCSPGGTIHLVVNNQIGFTTTTSEGRSTPYPTDIGKAYGIPILHVNGDQPLAAAAVARVAHAWRRRTGRDVIIDLVCYRRNGHNELDEPRFTQPVESAAIEKHPTLRALFTDTVQQRSRRAFDLAEGRREEFARQLEAAYATYANLRMNEIATETNVFPETNPKRTSEVEPSTGMDLDTLLSLGKTLTDIPDDFMPDPKVRAFARARWDSLARGTGINMATAEALAFASLLHEGTSVRLSGQDCVRGTFTQRHLAFHDAKDGRTIVPLASVAQGLTRFDAINSPLTEYGVLAFEYGMSLADPNRLCVWEAQFGDFLNGAQIVVDQYIVTAESKWRMQSSLVVALPHGLEGQGPDHSSARIERLLQSCAGGNVTIAVPSTPANLFHVLRRQQRGSRRTPLFLIAPKSLLREKDCHATLAEMGPGTRFRPVIVTEAPARCKRIVFCCGKVFYPLNELRLRQKLDDVALVRVEQLYPFPADEIRILLAEHPDADLIWCQEEPRNQGGFPYIFEQFFEMTGRPAIRFVGRPRMAAAAGGSTDRHEREQTEIVERALEGAA
ncbi:MAG TPA: 2-oxoglutarate dehydrogenase E1 component [Roseiarcus sp.]